MHILTLIHWRSVSIRSQGTTYLSVFPSPSSASLELTDAKEAQVPAATASTKPDIFFFSLLFPVKSRDKVRCGRKRGKVYVEVRKKETNIRLFMGSQLSDSR